MNGTEYRRLMGCWATGVSVITAEAQSGPAGATANALTSLSLDPPLVLVCFDLSSRTLHAVRESERFCINMLSSDQEPVSRLFATKKSQEEKFSETPHTLEHGAPVIDGCLAWLVCSLDSEFKHGDHVVAIGNVLASHVNDDRSPLVFYGGQYERVLKHHPLFSQLPKELLEQLLLRGHEERFPAGETLMSRGENTETLMLVTSGSVIVERPGRALQLGAGALIGEIEVLDPGAGRMATITAETDTTCVVISRTELTEGLIADPHAAIALLQILASRFRETG